MLDKIPVFEIQNEPEFIDMALKIFRFQAENNPVYKQFLSFLKTDVSKIDRIEQIPFLPIEFFKTYDVVSAPPPYGSVFLSSGTTGMQRSRNLVKDLSVYETSFTKGFQYFYGNISDYTILALLPSYVSQGQSSLVYMVNRLIELSGKRDSGFYLNDDQLPKLLNRLNQSGERVLLIGVSYALLDLVEKYSFNLSNTFVMETGGMKGRRKEILREDLHDRLKKGFGVPVIHSEYGMTELMSQSYSKGNGVFQSPPWQRILIRDTEDALTYLPEGKTGGINIIDLANIYSCSFIATQDLGKITGNNRFEILGRFDHSDIRGCNLLVVS